MSRLPLYVVLYAACTSAWAQQPATPAEAAKPAETAQAPALPAAPQPLPNLDQLLKDVDHNERTAEGLQNTYTYHVHFERQDFDSKGGLKKTTVIESESVSIDGVRVNRVVARDGKPLTPEEAAKESEKIDAQVAKARSRRDSAESKGKDTDARGNVILPAARILELGKLSNPRRIDLEGRPTIVVDYTGDPDAKTHTSFESVVRDLVGTVWIDEQDRALVRAHGQFRNDFKVGGGLVLDLHKGLTFDLQKKKINGEVWLPSVVDGRGSARLLLFDGINGHIHVVTSDYRKFRSTSTIVGVSGPIGTDGQPATPVVPAPASPAPAPAKP